MELVFEAKIAFVFKIGKTNYIYINYYHGLLLSSQVIVLKLSYNIAGVSSWCNG